MRVFIGLWAALLWGAIGVSVYGGLAGAPSAANTSGEVTGCVRCHTDVKKLIRLSWEVEKVRGKPRVSAMTEGEG